MSPVNLSLAADMHVDAMRPAVLAVDDVEANLIAVRALLEDMACEVVFAKSGNEALRHLLRRQFAVVLLDVQMPEMDGYEIAHHARKNPSTRDVPIIFLTAANNSEGMVLRGYGSGAVDFLFKPSNPSILRSKVRVFLDLHAAHHKVADAKSALEVRNAELNAAYSELQRTHAQLVQSAKMASLGELVAGVAPRSTIPWPSCSVTWTRHAVASAMSRSSCPRHCRKARSNSSPVPMIASAKCPEDVDPQSWARHYGVYSENRTDLLPASENPLIRAMAGESSASAEVFVRNEAVHGATVNMTATPLGGGQYGISGGVAVLRDVTEQRELEAQLSQSQKMDAIGRLAGGVAHDFNNLLVVIQSYTELVRDGLPANDPARSDLGEVLSAARRAATLTKQLLAFSRSETIQPVPLQLNDVVSGIEKMLHRIIGEDIELSTRLLPQLGLIRADPGQLDQVILNLSINARDAMPNGGQLVLETQNVTQEADHSDIHPNIEAGDFVVLVVTDTGTGMTPGTQRRIFEPFFTTKDVGEGTGLGLATVYGIVQQSGGQISVSSALGQGSVFTLYFPRLSGGSADAAGRTQSPAARVSRGTILVVEDYAAVRQVASRILRERGYTVLEARYPADARALCAEHGASIDLLLTDVIMPECTGPQLAGELIEQYPGMRVLYMSGYPGGAADRAGTLEAGAAYIEKPFSPDALLEKIRSALNQEA